MRKPTSVLHSRVPMDCEQSGCYYQAAECCTEIGVDTEEEEICKTLVRGLWLLFTLALTVTLLA